MMRRTLGSQEPCVRDAEPNKKKETQMLKNKKVPLIMSSSLTPISLLLILPLVSRPGADLLCKPANGRLFLD